MFKVNVFGVQNCFQAAAKQLIKQGNCTPEAPGKMIAVRLFNAYFHTLTSEANQINAI